MPQTADSISVIATNSRYIQRINDALDYLSQHYKRDVSLDELAERACFSKFHFHRVFKGVVGENVYEYLSRIRLERAAKALIYQPDQAIGDIALDHGFSSAAAFARRFKEHFGVSATRWRAQGVLGYLEGRNEKSKNRKVDSNEREAVSNLWKAQAVPHLYIDSSTNLPSWRIQMTHRNDVRVEVKHLPATPIAYIRHIGPFKGETQIWANLFNKLMTWGAARSVVSCPGTRFYTVFRDDLTLTDFQKFAADACISVPESTKSSGDITVSEIKAGQYAVAEFEVSDDEFEAAWDFMYREWLPDSGFQPDDRPCFERYLNDAKLHPEKKHIIEVCIPVRPI